MADVVERTITIVEQIYTMECITHSKNVVIRQYCLEHLSQAKTNHDYFALQTFPSISPYRACCKCNKMTMSMACSIYNVSADFILLTAQRNETFDDKTSGETIRITIDNIAFYTLKKRKSKWPKNKYK